jgi:RNA-directed DNA polymerase
MLAALVNGVKGGKWFSLMDKVYLRRNLEAAWRRVASNGGAAGVDKVSIKRFAAHQERYLSELEQALRTGSYRPQAVRRVYIPKPGGKQRPLGIPAVKDRIVQTALKQVLEPIFENEFLDMSYGFRPGRGCKDALRHVDRLLKSGYTWVVDADFASFFDTIPHVSMMERLKEYLSDGRVLALLERYLKQGILDGMTHWTPTQGTPQGAVASPLLANIYLHKLDKELVKAGYQVVRYADDFVILCQNREQAQQALSQVQAWTHANGLRLHPDKTHLGNCLEAGQGFEFLGYRFEAGRRYVRKKSWNALRDKIRQKTKRTCGKSLQRIIAELNPMLIGWFGYFKHAYPTTFSYLDGFIRRRLRAILRKQQKRPGQGHTLKDHQRWPNALFAEQGLFTTYEAHVAACRSR